MEIREGKRVPTRRRFVGRATATLVAMLSIAALALTSGALAAQAPVSLGTTASYAVLAGTTVTNAGHTTLNGDLGLSPGSSVTGFPPGEVNGVQNVANAAAVRAQSDLVTAYDDAAGRGPANTVAGGLGGLTLKAGVYSGGSLDLTGTLTLDAEGNSGAVFIFQAASTLITASSSSVALINGASPCNVFWQVGSSATLGTGTSFNGTILALTSIGLNTGANVDGRLLARNGAVTLESNAINASRCGGGSGGGKPPQEPGRDIYCTPTGVTYNLIAGQDKWPPYDALGLVPAFVDPVTGSKSCNFPAPPVAVPASTPPPTPTPTPAPAVAPKPKPARPPAKKGVAGAKKTLVVHVRPKPKPALHHVGFTG